MVAKEDVNKIKERITVGLDDFDHKVVSKMAKNRNLHLSEVVRTIVHQWIEYNPDLLKKNYGIGFREITEEILSDGYEVSLDKTIKPFESAIIQELPNFFEIVDSISIDDLAEHFNVDNKIIRRLIFIHGKEIKKLGLNLNLKNDIIFKS